MKREKEIVINDLARTGKIKKGKIHHPESGNEIRAKNGIVLNVDGDKKIIALGGETFDGNTFITGIKFA